MKHLNHLLVFACTVVLVCGARLLRPRYYERDMAAVAAKATALRASEIGAEWNAQIYEPFGMEHARAAILARADAAAYGLTLLQREKLEQTLRETLVYLSGPTFERYLQLKTSGLHCTFCPPAWSTNLMARESPLNIEHLEREPRRVLEVLWNAAHRGNGKFAVPKLSEVALSTVKAGLGHTNTGKALLVGPVKQGFTRAVEAFGSGIQYGFRNPADSQPLIFELSFLARANNSPLAGPVHVGLIWVPLDNAWAINRLITDELLHVQTLF